MRKQSINNHNLPGHFYICEDKRLVSSDIDNTESQLKGHGYDFG